MKEESDYLLTPPYTTFPKKLCWKTIQVNKAKETYCNKCEECKNLLEEAEQRGLNRLLIETGTGHLRIKS